VAGEVVAAASATPVEPAARAVEGDHANAHGTVREWVTASGCEGAREQEARCLRRIGPARYGTVTITSSI
jgi:hypothetical protein